VSSYIQYGIYLTIHVLQIVISVNMTCCGMGQFEEFYRYLIYYAYFIII